MGLFQSRRVQIRDAKVVILGLDNAGKSTILRRMTNKETTHTVPTKGFQIDTLVEDDLRFIMWDVGGQRSVRSFWSSYFDNITCLVWVIDAADADRLEETSMELTTILRSPSVDNVPVVVMSNKIDLSTALRADDIARRLNLHAIRDREWSIREMSARTGDGVEDGIRWLAKVVKRTWKERNSSRS